MCEEHYSQHQPQDRKCHVIGSGYQFLEHRFLRCKRADLLVITTILQIGFPAFAGDSILLNTADHALQRRSLRLLNIRMPTPAPGHSARAAYNLALLPRMVQSIMSAV